MKIAVVGGTGDLWGLAVRLAIPGHTVIIGSRNQEKAIRKAKECEKECEKVLENLGYHKESKIYGMKNEDAAKEADIVILALPWEESRTTIRELRDCLKGKIVVSPIAPMIHWKEKGKTYMRYPPAFLDRSMAEEIAEILDESRVVAALHTVPAKRYFNPDVKFCWNTFVVSDDEEAKKIVINLINQVEGIEALDAGPLSVSAAISEGFVSFLINVAKLNKLKTLGIKLVYD